MSIESAKVISLKFEQSSEQDVHKVQIKEKQFNDVVVNLAGKDVVAKVSFSCLVQPIVGDSVLIAGSESEGFFILSILERSESQAMSLVFPENAVMKSLNGSIIMSAKDTIATQSDKAVIKSNEVIHDSSKAFVNYDDLNANSEEAVVNVKKLSLMSDLVTTMARNVINKFKTYVRKTEESDAVNCGQMQRDVKGIYSMNSKYTVMLSKKDTKIDGQHIHMG